MLRTATRMRRAAIKEHLRASSMSPVTGQASCGRLRPWPEPAVQVCHGDLGEIVASRMPEVDEDSTCNCMVCARTCQLQLCGCRSTIPFFACNKLLMAVREAALFSDHKSNYYSGQEIKIKIVHFF